MCSIFHNSAPAGIGDIGGPAISAQPLISLEGDLMRATVAVHLEGYSLVVIIYYYESNFHYIAIVSPATTYVFAAFVTFSSCSFKLLTRAHN